jgi:hypothetical protein
VSVTPAFEFKNGGFGNDRGLSIGRTPEHRRMRRSWHTFKRGDIGAVALAIALVAVFIYAAIKYPGWQRPTGFGPQWQCDAPGRGGTSFCIRKPPAIPADQTTTPN